MMRRGPVTGSLDAVEWAKDFGWVLSGWARDARDADGKVGIAVVAGDLCVAVSSARYFRRDLIESGGAESGGGCGFHGFAILLPMEHVPGPAARTFDVIANGERIGRATIAPPGDRQPDASLFGGRNQGMAAGIAPDDRPVDVVGDLAMLRSGGIFDARWYERAYPDVAEWCRGMGASPYLHYLAFGRAQNRLPHVPVNEGWYLERHGAAIRRMGGVAARGAADHYHVAGSLFGFDAVPGFDEQTYLGLNPDVRAAVEQGRLVSGYRHYLLSGAAEGRPAPPGGALPPCPLHELLESPELASLVKDGASAPGPTGRDWAAWNARRAAGAASIAGPIAAGFAEDLYRAHRPDVAEGIACGHLASAAEHWSRYGLAEDMAGTTPRLEGYCEHRYLASNPDVAEAVSNGRIPSGYHHFLTHGHAERRRGGPDRSDAAARGVPSTDILGLGLGQVAAHGRWPTISVLMPVYRTPERWLRAAIESVLAQFYPYWELCIVDDASPDPHIRALLEEYAARDRRIRVVRHPTNGGIAAASNTALSMAQGAWIALLDHDDQLTPDALLEVAAAIVAHEPDAVYSDEDKLGVDGRFYDATHKPGWSPELLRGTMYIGHLTCYRTAIVRSVGGFRSACDGTQDYDLALRVAGVTDRFVHIPKILYHWVAIPGSAADVLSAKSYAVERQKTAIEDAVAQQGATPFEVRPHWRAGNWRVVHAPPSPAPLVSIVIPSAGHLGDVLGMKVDLLKNCVMSVFGSGGYDNVEVVVVHNGELDAETLAFLRAFPAVREFDCRRPTFNFSERVNLGVEWARGDYVLLLNDDTQVISRSFLRDMVGLASQPGVGVVGPRLLFANGTIQHVGTLLLNGVPTHALIGEHRLTPGPQGIAQLTHNAVAATGACMLVSRRLYQDVGGFDTRLPVNYNDVDFCNRVRAKGLRIVIDPAIELYHFESQSKEGTFDWELQEFVKRWGLGADPYLNPNFSTASPFYGIERAPPVMPPPAPAA